MAAKVGWFAIWILASAIGLVGCADMRPWTNDSLIPPVGAIDAVADAAALPTVDPQEARRPASKEEESRLSFARLSERRDQTQLARNIYRQVIKDNPQSVIAHHRLGVLAARAGKLEEANRYLESARNLAPPTAELLSDIGYCYYLQNRPDEAEQTLRAAMQLDPKHESSANNLGLVLGEQQRFDESMRIFQRVGSAAQAHANMAFIHVQLGNYDQAQEHYSQSLSLDPDSKTAASAMIQIAEQQRSRSYGKPPTASATVTATHQTTQPAQPPTTHQHATTQPRLTVQSPTAPARRTEIVSRQADTALAHTSNISTSKSPSNVTRITMPQSVTPSVRQTASEAKPTEAVQQKVLTSGPPPHGIRANMIRSSQRVAPATQTAVDQAFRSLPQVSMAQPPIHQQAARPAVAATQLPQQTTETIFQQRLHAVHANSSTFLPLNADTTNATQ